MGMPATIGAEPIGASAGMRRGPRLPRAGSRSHEYRACRSWTGGCSTPTLPARQPSCRADAAPAAGNCMTTLPAHRSPARFPPARLLPARLLPARFLPGIALLAVVSLATAFPLPASAAPAPAPDTIPAAEPASYLIARRADPWIHRHDDGYYYFIATVPEFDRIELRRAPTIDGLADADATVIWRKHASGAQGAYIWAPELHRID